jgi:hypothetical protein
VASKEKRWAAVGQWAQACGVTAVKRKKEARLNLCLTPAF